MGMIPSAVGAALVLPPKPNFAIIGRCTRLSNKITPTESTMPRIWTSLKFSSPSGTKRANPGSYTRSLAPVMAHSAQTAGSWATAKSGRKKHLCTKGTASVVP
jgi:hypothetical protein